QAVENVEEPIGVLAADVACAKPAVEERLCGFLRVVPITAHDIGAASDQFASLTGLDLRARSVDDPDLNASSRPPARGQSLADMLIVAQSGKKTGFAQPVALHQSDAGQDLAGAADKLGGHRRPAVGDLLEAREIVRFELRELRQQVDYCRHQNGVADARALDGL